jgi:hypothetical protein
VERVYTSWGIKHNAPGILVIKGIYSGLKKHSSSYFGKDHSLKQYKIPVICNSRSNNWGLQYPVAA